MPSPPNLPTTHVDNNNEAIKAGDINDLALAVNDVFTNGAKPKGAAGGVLAGTYPNPSLAAGAATGAALGSDVIRVGTAAGGSLAGTYPNPTIPAKIIGKLFNVQAYGAVGDSVTRLITSGDIAANPQWVGTYTAGVDDWDTVGIQEAIYACLATPRHSGTVYFPAPTQYYRVTSTIKCFRLDYAAAQVNMFAEAGANSGWVMRWFGPTDVNAGGICLEVMDNWNTVFQNISVANQQARGTSIGILISKEISGTGDSGNTYINCTAYGFSTGIQVGGGVLGPGGNASEQVFISCGATYCDVGVRTVGFNTLNLYWINLLISQNVLGANFQTGNSAFIMGGSASNNSTGDFVFNGGGTATLAYFRSENGSGPLVDTGSTMTTLLSNVVSNPPASGPSIILGSNVTMIGNRINGYVQAKAVGPLTLLNNEVQPAPVSGDVFDSIGGISDGAYDLRSNSKLGTNDQFDDRVGYSDHAVSPTFLGILHRITRSTHQLAAQDLRAVQGISGSPLQAKNLRGTAVLAAGAATVTFGAAEVQTVTETGSPTGGTWRAWTAHNVVTNNLAFDITAATLQTALLALPLLGGVGLVFAPGDIVCSGGPLNTAPIVITFAGARATGPQYLFFTTTALTGGSSPAVAITRTTPGTFTEVDGSYTIQLTGNVNETFWVTGKSSTGFTIHSSNGASAASVDWMLIR